MSKSTAVPFNKLFLCGDIEFSQRNQDGIETRSASLKLRRQLKNRDSGTLLLLVVQTTNPANETVITRTFTSMWCRINEDKYAIVDDDIAQTHDIKIFARALVDVSSPLPVNDYVVAPDIFNVVNITSRKWSGREMMSADDPECIAWSNTVIRNILTELTAIAETEEFKVILAIPAWKPKKSKAASKTAVDTETELAEPTLAGLDIVAKPAAKSATKSKAKKAAATVVSVPEPALVELDV